MDFQQRFKDLLTENEVKYSFVASKTGIPVTTLSNYINRGSAPSISQLSILADFFGCSIDYLVGREDDFGNVTAAPALPAGLDSQEEELIKNFRLLNMYQRDALSLQAKIMADEALKVIKK